MLFSCLFCTVIKTYRTIESIEIHMPTSPSSLFFPPLFADSSLLPFTRPPFSFRHLPLFFPTFTPLPHSSSLLLSSPLLLFSSLLFPSLLSSFFKNFLLSPFLVFPFMSSSLFIRASPLLIHISPPLSTLLFFFF